MLPSCLLSTGRGEGNGAIAQSREYYQQLGLLDGGFRRTRLAGLGRDADPE